MWLHGLIASSDYKETPTSFSKTTNSSFLIAQVPFAPKSFRKHFSGVATTPRFSKPFSKLYREFFHPRVFGSTTSVSQRLRC
jgi:hypothetical protein